jgi:hypothetical protein
VKIETVRVARVTVTREPGEGWPDVGIRHGRGFDLIPDRLDIDFAMIPSPPGPSVLSLAVGGYRRYRDGETRGQYLTPRFGPHVPDELAKLVAEVWQAVAAEART